MNDVWEKIFQDYSRQGKKNFHFSDFLWLGQTNAERQIVDLDIEELVVYNRDDLSISISRDGINAIKKQVEADKQAAMPRIFICPHCKTNFGQNKKALDTHKCPNKPKKTMDMR